MGDLSLGQPPTMASFLTLTCSQRFSPLREERALSLWLPGSLGFFSSARILEPELKLDEMELEMKTERERGREGGTEVGRLVGR